MDSLRIALLVIGIVIVAVIYWSARRKPSADIRNSSPGRRIEPGFGESDDDDEADHSIQVDLPLGDEPAVQRNGVRSAPDRQESVEPDDDMPGASDRNRATDDDLDDDGGPEVDNGAPKVPEKVISLRIVKKDGSDFGAEEVILNLRGVGLVHGRFGIFHRHFDEDDKEAVFSVASLTEPGSFDLQNLRDKRLAGLSFFMLRPGPGRGVDAFDKMVETARAVAISLQGDLLDGEGSTMSIQRERFMREDLIQYELKHLKL